MTQTNLYNDIYDFVDDHYEHFHAYPMEVEVDNKVYTYDEYWAILRGENETE